MSPQFPLAFVVGGAQKALGVHVPGLLASQFGDSEVRNLIVKSHSKQLAELRRASLCAGAKVCSAGPLAPCISPSPILPLLYPRMQC